jgi:Gpi18-like mannosyltransferase
VRAKVSHIIQKIREWRPGAFEALTVSFFLFLLLFLPEQTFDWGSYVVWASYMRSEGLAQIYSLQYVNYMPLNVFAIFFWQAVMGVLGISINVSHYFLKIYPMFFDCLSVLLALHIAKKWKFSPIWVLICLLPNIAFHYNSMIWGQFDSVYTFFVVMAMYFLIEKRFFGASVMYLLALNAKIQAIIFLPVLILYAIVVVGQSRENLSLKKTLPAIALSALFLLAMQWVFFSPFTQYSPFQILSLIWMRSSQLSKYVTFNADNIWILLGANTMLTVDTEVFIAGFRYKTIGYVLFVLSSGIALLPALATGIKVGMNHFQTFLPFKMADSPSYRSEQLFLQATLAMYIVSLSFFFFMTQMHERYVHPAVFLAALVAIMTRKPLLLATTSVAYVINMERINQFWQVTEWASYAIRLDMIAAGLYLFSLILAFITLYEKWQKSPMKQ